MQSTIIVAMTEDRVIGYKNTMPWHVPADMAFFKQTTLHNTVIMGRKTYESIGRPLPQRNNIIITSQTESIHPNCLQFCSIEQAIEQCRQSGHKQVYIIGGATIYEQAISLVQSILLTLIPGVYVGDSYFPPLPSEKFTLVSKIPLPGTSPEEGLFLLTYQRKR